MNEDALKVGVYVKSWQIVDGCIGEDAYACIVKVVADYFGAVQRLRWVVKVYGEVGQAAAYLQE